MITMLEEFKSYFENLNIQQEFLNMLKMKAFIDKFETYVNCL